MIRPHSQIHSLVDIILYIRNNETTAHIIFIHAYQHVGSIPRELAPNIKILDEAFPTVTVDLIFVQGTFGPTVGSLALPHSAKHLMELLCSSLKLSALSKVFFGARCSCLVLGKTMVGTSQRIRAFVWSIYELSFRQDTRISSFFLNSSFRVPFRRTLKAD